MATYYVRPDGNDSNTGLGAASNLAWRTVQKALGATGIGSGDTVYIAPGTYRENITIGGTYTAATYIIGDPTAAQFTDVPQGLVRLTNYLTTDTAAGSGTIMSSGNKNYLNISYLYFDGSATMLSLGRSANCFIENCAFIGSSAAGSTGISTSVLVSVTYNQTIRKCIFMVNQGIQIFLEAGGSSDWSIGVTVHDCILIGTGTALAGGIRTARGGGAPYYQGGGINIYNCYIQSFSTGVLFENGDATYPPNVRNCLIVNCGTGITGKGSPYNVQDYNRIIGCTTNLNNMPSAANTVTVGPVMVDIGMSQLFGLSAKQTWFSALPGSLNIGFGEQTGALTTDLFGATWFNGSGDPDVGALTSIQLSGTGYYLPTERNITNLTIAPNSTSRSETIYLGVTGLTHLTSGLSASYVRTGSARVGFSLASQTVTGAWVSGGFVEIDAVNMPGMYRIDIPNAAFSSGSTSVTVAIKNSNTAFGTYLSYSLQPVHIDLTQTVPYSNAVQTIGDALNAARSSGFGKWTLNDKTLTLYGGDNTTVVKTFTLNSSTYPTERS